MTPPPGIPLPPPTPACEAHSIALAVMESELADLKDDLRNHRTWRAAVEKKLDDLRQSIHRLELRLYLVLGGIAAAAWCYEHWFRP